EVVETDIVAGLEKRVPLGSKDQGLRSARADAKTDIPFHVGRDVGSIMLRAPDETSDRAANMGGDWHQANEPLPAEDVVGGEHLDRRRLGRARGEVEDAVELLLA